MNIEEDVVPWIMGAGAILGLFGIEYLYFTNADEVRLLFVILLAPVGAIAGALLLTAVVYGIVALVGISAIAGIVAIVIAVIAAIIYGLYSIVVWSN